MNSRNDTFPGLVVLVFGVAVMLLSLSLDYRQIIANDPLSPASVPTGLGILLVASGAILAVRGRVRSARGAGETSEGSDRPADQDGDQAAAIDRRALWRVAATVGACVGFAVLMPIFGFAVSAPLFFIAITMLAAGAERLVLAVCLAIAVPASCYLIFSQLLSLPIQLLPSSP